MERDDTVSLHDYWVVVRRRRWLILSTVVLAVVVAVVASLARTPLYEARAEVAVEPLRRAQDASLEELLSPTASVVNTERLVMTSRPVAERVADELGLADPAVALERVRVDTVGDTRVVRIVATHADPVAAAETADAFAGAYLEYRRDEAVDSLLDARTNLEGRASALRDAITELDEADEVDEVERDALLVQLSQILAQMAELGDVTSMVTGGGAILTPAEVPSTPVSPRPFRTGALAGLLGLLLGIGLAFLRDHVDDVIRDEGDVRRASGDRPILGRIPSWDDPDGGHRLATVLDPSSLAAEAYRELSVGVRFLLIADDDVPTSTPEGSGSPLGRSLMVCSPTAGDGKTSTAGNLAVAAARVGLRTLLVEADLRRPTLGERFGLGRVSGLADLLLSGDEVARHVAAVGIDNLLLLPAGTLPPNPAELLASQAMRALHDEFADHADLVIYDTPAVLAVPDALELANHVDIAVLVSRAAKTGRRQLHAATERLEQVGTRLAGTVLNGIAESDGYYYSYYYDAGPPVDERSGRRRSQPAQRRAALNRQKERRPTGAGAGARPARRGGAEPTVPRPSSDRDLTPDPASGLEPTDDLFGGR